MDPQMRARSGMSILEVLVALIILAIILPGLAGMIISSRKAQTANIHMDQAYAYGQLLMDSLALTPNWAHWTGSQSSKSASTTIAGKTYTGTITPLPSGSALIRVDWVQGNTPHSIQLREVLSSSGLYR